MLCAMASNLILCGLIQLITLWCRHYYLPLYRWRNRGWDNLGTFPKVMSGAREPSFSKCGLWISSFSIPWRFNRNAGSQATPQTSRIQISSPDLHAWSNLRIWLNTGILSLLQWLSNMSCHRNHLGLLLNRSFAGPTSKSPDSVGLGWGPGISFFNSSPCGSKVGGVGTTLWETCRKGISLPFLIC